MEKSIKNIWDSCSGTEWVRSEMINLDFESQKSKSTIEKMNRIIRIDYWSIIPVSLIGLGYVVYEGDTAATIYFLFIIAIMFSINLRNMRVIRKVDANLDSYTYVLRYYETFRALIKHLTLFMGCIFPLIMAPFYYLLVRNEDWFVELLAKMEIPVFLLYLAFTLLLSMVSITSYRLTVHLVYGRLLKRLKRLIEDMKLLR